MYFVMRDIAARSTRGTGNMPLHEPRQHAVRRCTTPVVKQEASGALDIIDQILWPFSCVRQEQHCNNSTQALEVHGTIVHNTYVVKEQFVWKRCVMRPLKLRETV